MSDETTPTEGTRTQKQSRAARYLSENTGTVIPLGVMAGLALYAGMNMFQRIENGSDQTAAIDKRLSVLEASSSEARLQFSSALSEMRAARTELASLHDIVIELRSDIRSQHAVAK